MTDAYDDIIRLPHHQSAFHKPMPIKDRAAQFSPFAALTGYDDEVTEAGRLTARQIRLEEHDLEVLDRKLEWLIGRMQEVPGENPEVRVTWFQPDEKKEGGSYETLTGRLRRLDLTKRVLVFSDRREVSLDRIMDMELIETGLRDMEMARENCAGEESLL